MSSVHIFSFFFLAPSPTALYTLSLHDALPISAWRGPCPWRARSPAPRCRYTARRSRRAPPAGSPPHRAPRAGTGTTRSEEHTSELQSRGHLVCRLLLEKKKKKTKHPNKQYKKV